MDSESIYPNPERLKTLAADVKFSEGNTLLHRLVIDQSRPNHPSGSGNYVNAVLLSMSDVPARVVNALNDDGYSALHLAVTKGNLTMVKQLLSRLVNIDVDARCGRGYGDTALHLAVESGNSSIVRELLDKGASIAIMNRVDETALSVATRLRALDLVKILVGADVNQHTPYNTPLHEAARYGSLEITQFLLDRGADVDARNERSGSTPLHDAAIWGNLDIVKLLIGKGADVHATSEDGATLLHYASLFVNSEMAAFLIDQGADVDARDDSGRTPLYDAAFDGNLDIVKLLISKGADLHAADVNGRTPLHYAAYGGHADVTRALLESGADVNAIAVNGKTPLDIAREEQKQSCIDVLENV